MDGRHTDLSISVKLAACLAVFLAASCGGLARRNIPSVIVLGIDGMDPKFLEEHWADLPNLDKLRRAGEFKRLATTMPPQSPVAWSTFITGTGPEQHGIYDFVHRDPRTMLPFSSMGETAEPAHSFSIGPYRFPLTAAKVRTFRRGEAFWQRLAERHIPIQVLRMPTNYPPVDCEGESLAGMGVPDMEGTFGTFTFFTDDALESLRDVPGGRIVPVQVQSQRTVMRVPGPSNTYRKDQAATFVDVTVDVDPTEPVARFTVQDRSFILRQGEWSEWIEVDFPIVPGLKSAHGMFRLYAKRLSTEFRVYCSPVNVDPSRPELKISVPASYSGRLARATGLYYTQGIAEDTAALRQGIFDRGEYLSQSRMVAREHIALLKQAVLEFRGGFLFFHFFGVDQGSHMLWRRFDSDLLGIYKMVDAAVGWVCERAKGATILVMSDHGFSTFDRAVNLNTWLLKEGLLKLKDPYARDEGELFANVDWSRTRAYALGLNALYINLSGRERNGIVSKSAAPGLVEQIASRLKGFRDPEKDAAVVTGSWAPHPRFEGDVQYAPDLVVGFNAGYRASWGGALGSVSAAAIEDNLDAWIGDHCIDAQHVPGVLIGSRKSQAPDPQLKDLPVSILGLFGVPTGRSYTGRDLYH
jgi:predicted AlkP superfamily phosphohydrolase/phosphomutase